MSHKEELVAGLKWMLDTSEDNAEYIALLIIAAVKEDIENEFKQRDEIYLG
jgi:hypothetical protein